MGSWSQLSNETNLIIVYLSQTRTFIIFVVVPLIKQENNSAVKSSLFALFTIFTV